MYSWMLAAYRELDRKYKKNLKRLLIVHPTGFIKVVMTIFKPIISWKFGRKLTNIDRISQLNEFIYVEQIAIPSEVGIGWGNCSVLFAPFLLHCGLYTCSNK